MFEFGDSFKRIMGEQGYSVSSFSKLTGLDRGWLYAIFAGKRKIPEQTLQKILTGSFFTQENSQQLRRAFYEEVYGNDQMERILYLQDHFQEFRRPASPRPDGASSHGRARAGFRLFGHPVGTVWGGLPADPPSAEGRRLPTRCTPTCPSALPSSTTCCFTPSKTISLLTPCTASCPCSKTTAAPTTWRCCFPRCGTWTKRPTSITTTPLSFHDQQIDQLFPYYLASPRAVLLIHQNGEQGQLILDQGFCGQIKESFFAALEHCSQMTYSYQSALSFLSTGHEMRSTDYTVELGNTFTMLLNQDLLQRYGSPRFTGVSRAWG